MSFGALRAPRAKQRLCADVQTKRKSGHLTKIHGTGRKARKDSLKNTNLCLGCTKYGYWSRDHRSCDKSVNDFKKADTVTYLQSKLSLLLHCFLVTSLEFVTD